MPTDVRAFDKAKRGFAEKKLNIIGYVYDTLINLYYTVYHAQQLSFSNFIFLFLYSSYVGCITVSDSLSLLRSVPSINLSIFHVKS